MTIWELYCRDNNGDNEYVGLDTYVGKRVKHIIYGEGDGVETWSDSVHTIESFDGNVCGDGCCSGYTISDDERGMSWRSDQLLVVDEE